MSWFSKNRLGFEYSIKKMIKISKKLEYSLMALKYMKDKLSSESPFLKTTAREVADEFSLPFDTTAKVLQTLNSKKILNSTQGKSGGYSLNVSLDKISYLELSQIIDGRRQIINCEPCEISNSCNISTPLKNLNRSVENYFNSLSLEDLLNDYKLINKTENLNERHQYES